MSTDTQEIVEAPLYRFRVRSGTYWKPEPVRNEDTNEFVRDAKGGIVTKDVIYGPKRLAGDIVETNVNLRKFNTPNRPAMFELLDHTDNPMVHELAQTQERAEAAERRYRRALATMTQRELLDHAQLEGINLKGETDERRVRTILLREAGLEPEPAPTNTSE